MQGLYVRLAALQDRIIDWWHCPRGHADMLQMTATRIYLRCGLCDRQTAGWDIALTGTTRTAEGGR